MKTIFITVYDGDVEKNILQSKVLRALKQAGVRIVLLIKNGIGHNYKHYRDANTIVEELPNSLCFSEKLFYWIGWNILPTRSIYLRRHRSYKLHRNWIRHKFGEMLGICGKSRRFRQWLRWAYAHIPDNYGEHLFEQYKPDLLFAPSMFSFEDGRLLRMAKKRGIRTITMTKSWDVLTNKAFTRVLADKILVQNTLIRNIAIQLGDYTPRQVEVVGFVQFDFVADPSILLPREKFFEKIGADPDKKLILYSTSGDWKNPYDDEVVRGIHRAIEKGEILPPAQILARFHPKYSSKVERLELPFLIKYRPCESGEQVESFDSSDPRVYSFTFGADDLADLANMLYHSDVTINTMSSITLDAISFDKPVILICHDGINRSLPYLDSLRQAYDEDHYRVIMEHHCAKVSHRMEDTVEAISAYLADPTLDAEGRAYIREHVLYKLDGNSGARIAGAVLRSLR